LSYNLTVRFKETQIPPAIYTQLDIVTYTAMPEMKNMQPPYGHRHAAHNI